jgi:hypothetical protein
LGPESSSLSFGGLGGGGGPGLEIEVACAREGGLPGTLANLPASGRGGGAANLGGGGPLGGEGSRGGVVGSAFAADLRDGGGAGGAARRPVALTGLSDLVLEVATGGGGGGGAFPL